MNAAALPKACPARTTTARCGWFAAGLLAAALAAPGLARADDQELRRQIMGSWSEQPGCPAVRLTFREDGTLTVNHDPTVETGRYSISNGTITLTSSSAGKPPLTSPLTISGDTATVTERGAPSTLYRCPAGDPPAR